jgi:hypothetical protein
MGRDRSRQRAPGPVGVRRVDPFGVDPFFDGCLVDEQIGRAVALEVTALHEDGAGPEGQDRARRAPHVVARVDVEARESRGLGEVGRHEGREREDQAAESINPVLRQQRMTVLRDEDRVNHEVREPHLLGRLGDGLDDRGRREHPRLRRVHADVPGDRADLLGDHIGRDLLEAGDPLRVLHRHRGDRGHPEDPERAERLQVRLDPGPAAGVGTGDREGPWPWGAGAVHDGSPSTGSDPNPRSPLRPSEGLPSRSHRRRRALFR